MEKNLMLENFTRACCLAFFYFSLTLLSWSHFYHPCLLIEGTVWVCISFIASRDALSWISII